VALGDTGKGNDGQRNVAAAIAAKCARDGCDFALLLGDNVYDSGVASPDDPLFQTVFEEPYRNVDLPFYVILGNHDYGGNGAGYELFKGPYEVQYSQRSTKWRMPAEYYRFREAHVEIFGLDTNKQMYNQAAEQRQDVRGWIRGSTATWKIAMGHHPYLSNGPHGNAGEYDGLPFVPIANGAGVKNFMDDIVCGKVDLYLCGHDHSRQWLTGTCDGTELAVSGAGATTTDLPGRNPTRFQASTLGFLYVRIEGRTLTAEFLDARGTVEFTRTITK
jgi:tartrate-resistant acid phosphatase type 5